MNILDPDMVESCVAVYQITWNDLCNAKGNFSGTPKASEKSLLLAKYDRCLAKIIKLQKQAKGATVDEDVFNRLHAAYNATVNRMKDSAAPLKKRRMGAMLVQRPIDKLLAAWIAELQNQKNRLRIRPLNGKKGRSMMRM